MQNPLARTVQLVSADAITALADTLTEYEIARAIADGKHPDNEGARLIAAHKFAKAKAALAALNRDTLR